MRKIISLLMVAAVMTLAACGGDKTDPAPENPGNDTPQTPGTPTDTPTAAKDRFLYFGDPSVSEPFYTQGGDTYTLTVDFDSPWGCLVRTRNDDQWPAGSKYGAPAGSNTLEWGKPMTLVSNAGTDPADILLPGMKRLMYHSHFWTPYFADLDYGDANSCETSPAFKAICAAAKGWIDKGVDGLRLDGAKHIYHNERSDENHIFWGKMFDELNGYWHSKGHADNFYMVGEVFSGYDDAKPYFKGLPSIFEFDFWWQLRDGINKSTGSNFAKTICGYRDGYKSVREDYIISTKLTNHDEDRAKSSLGGSDAKAKLAGAVLLTASGSPYIYYGEELGYVGIKEGKGDEYVRNPMKWGDSFTTTYIKQVDSGMNNVKDAAAQSADEKSVLAVYRRFAQLRNTYPALAHGTMTPHPTISAAEVAAWYMEAEGQKMLVLHNFSGKVVNLDITDNIAAVVAALGDKTAVETADGKTTAKLDSYSSIVALLDDAEAAEEWDGEKRADLSYQLLIYSFADSNGDGIGDFNGITSKMDYFDRLGVSALWLSPAHPASSYHGYDVMDYTALNPDYGTEADFRNLIEEAHRHGIKIYMDWVINHTSKDHPWFKAALADAGSEYRNYYIFSEDPEADIAAGRIPMIATEGRNGYDSGQWYSAVSGDGGKRKLKFTLKWGSAPTLTVEEVK